MMNTVFTSLIINAALLISLIPFYSLIRRLTKDNTKNSILIGVIFGGAAIAGMNLPFQYIPGIIYDGRSIILSLTGLFGGYPAGIVSILIAGLYRFYLGGNGVWAGVATILLCTLAGVAFRKWLKGKPEDVSVFALYIFGVSAHIIMLACQMLLIPFPRGIEVIGKIWLPVIVVFPVATVIMGLFLRGEEARIKTEEARDRAEEERKRLEQQFLQAQKLESIGRLAGGVAHDFNNILSVIIGYGELILARLAHDDPLRDYVTQIVDAGKRAAGLTNQLLAFSRKQILRPGSIDLNELLKNTEKMLRRLIGEDIELILKLSDNLPNIYADSVQTEQVILNLAVNARDAMPQGGRLTIETSVAEIDERQGEIPLWFKPGRYVLLTVSDTGAGINEKDMDNIFEPFFTTKETGTGLGLATVYGIVKQSGGNIVVDSKEGTGTSFKVYLPIAEKIEGMDTAKEKKDMLHEAKGQHILVVEDEEMVRNLLSIALTDKGFSVTVAKDAEEALEILEGQDFKPDLLITDIVMPGMSGRALAEHLKKTMPELKIIYMSGYTDDTIVRHGVTDRKIPLIQKPFNMGEFISQIQRLLSDGEE